MRLPPFWNAWSRTARWSCISTESPASASPRFSTKVGKQARERGAAVIHGSTAGSWNLHREASYRDLSQCHRLSGRPASKTPQRNWKASERPY